MNNSAIRKVLFIWLILPILATAIVETLNGQERPEAVQVDEMGNVSCDDFLARIDNFFVQIQKDPTMSGLMVISGDRKYLQKKVNYELVWEGATNWRRYDASRVTIIRGQESGDFNMRFWLIPAGAEQPQFERTERNLKLPPGAKPFVVHSDLEQICSTDSFPKAYAEYLYVNHGSRGNVVVFASSRRTYLKGLKEAKAKLKNIPSTRLKFFYSYTNTLQPYAEYWIVP